DGLSDTQAIAVTVTGVNEAPTTGGVEQQLASMEAGSTQKAPGLSPLTHPENDPPTHKVTSLPPAGSPFPAHRAAVALKPELTQAEFLALPSSSPQSTGPRLALFDVSDGVNHTNLTVDLNVPPPVNGTYVGNAGVNRLDGAAGNDTINGLAGADTMI